MRFSTLQRAEIAEIDCRCDDTAIPQGFSTLQRAEIAEIERIGGGSREGMQVSVLFNEPKLLKFVERNRLLIGAALFQYSSTSRNC